MPYFSEIGVRYFGNRMLGHLITDLKRLKKDGFNSILHIMTEEDLKYNPGTVKEFIKATADMGFKAWIEPRGAGRVFEGEYFSNLPVNNPASWQVGSDNKKIPAVCMNNPVFRNYMFDWADFAVKTGAYGIVMDEPHFASKTSGKKNIWACRCAYCRESYEIQNQRGIPFKPDFSVLEFRDESVKKLINDISIHVNIRTKGRMKISASLPVSAGVLMEKTAKIKELESVGIKPYWSLAKDNPDIYSFCRSSALRVKDACTCAGKSPVFWLQGFGYRAGKEKAVLEALRAAKDAGIKKIWVSGLETSPVSMPSGRPDEVWKMIVKGIKD